MLCLSDCRSHSHTTIQLTCLNIYSNRWLICIQWIQFRHVDFVLWTLKSRQRQRGQRFRRHIQRSNKNKNEKTKPLNENNIHWVHSQRFSTFLILLLIACHHSCLISLTLSHSLNIVPSFSFPRSLYSLLFQIDSFSFFSKMETWSVSECVCVCVCWRCISGRKKQNKKRVKAKSIWIVFLAFKI